jgi:uncharacterized protein (DUF983 family)
MGLMFSHKPYNLSGYDKMFHACPHCGLVYDIEPGFFTGAMYVSYAFSMIIFIVVGIALYVSLNDPSVWVYTSCTFLCTLILYPLSYRYSRVLYLHLFGGIRYRGDGAD